MTILLAILVAVCAWLLLRRANELCVVRVEGGAARLAKGRAPGRLLYDIGEIARRAGLEDATIRVTSESGSPRVQVSGAVTEAVIQQIRNVVGEHQVLHFRTGRRPGR